MSKNKDENNLIFLEGQYQNAAIWQEEKCFHIFLFVFRLPRSPLSPKRGG
jgi:hypothetical protein